MKKKNFYRNLFIVGIILIVLLAFCIVFSIIKNNNVKSNDTNYPTILTDENESTKDEPSIIEITEVKKEYDENVDYMLLITQALEDPSSYSYSQVKEYERLNNLKVEDLGLIDSKTEYFVNYNSWNELFVSDTMDSYFLKKNIKYMVYNADTINLREGYDTSHKKIAQLPKFTEVIFICSVINDYDRVWHKVYYGDFIGYINGNYCMPYDIEFINQEKEKEEKERKKREERERKEREEREKEEAIKKQEQTSEDSSLKYIGKFKLTAYCPCTSCSDNWGSKTSTGVTAKQGRTIAVDPKVIPYGTKVVINGKTYIAEDCGSAIKSNKIDIYFNSHSEASKFGIKYAKVYIVRD